LALDPTFFDGGKQLLEQHRQILARNREARKNGRREEWARSSVPKTCKANIRYDLHKRPKGAKKPRQGRRERKPRHGSRPQRKISRKGERKRKRLESRYSLRRSHPGGGLTGTWRRMSKREIRNHGETGGNGTSSYWCIGGENVWTLLQTEGGGHQHVTDTVGCEGLCGKGVAGEKRGSGNGRKYAESVKGTSSGNLRVQEMGPRGRRGMQVAR